MFFSIRRVCLMVTVLASATVIHADVLLDGKNPVDKGTGDVIGTEVRWRDCNGTSKTFRNPPYNIIKHANDCNRIGPKDVAPDPGIFGLTCADTRFTETEIPRRCTVTDTGMARHFFDEVRIGERVTYKMQRDDLVLTHGRIHLIVDTEEWHNTAKSRIE